MINDFLTCSFFLRCWNEEVEILKQHLQVCWWPERHAAMPRALDPAPSQDSQWKLGEGAWEQSAWVYLTNLIHGRRTRDKWHMMKPDCMSGVAFSPWKQPRQCSSYPKGLCSLNSCRVSRLDWVKTRMDWTDHVADYESHDYGLEPADLLWCLDTTDL